jgi:hypothetical protein
MKHYLRDMELFNARLRPVVKTPGGFVRQAGNAGNDESFTEERLFGFPLPAISAFTAF